MNLRKEAKGRVCMIRIPGVCNGNPETTVLAHLNGGGIGIKHNDIIGAWACSDCHNAIDGRANTDLGWYHLRHLHLEGIIRTQIALIEEGKL